MPDPLSLGLDQPGQTNQALIAGLSSSPQQPPVGLGPNFEKDVSRVAKFLQPPPEMAGLLTKQESAKADELRAAQQQKVAEAQGIDTATTKFGESARAVLDRYQSDMAHMPLPAFVPSKESAGDLSLLGSLIAMAGIMAGKGRGMQPGLTALSAMTGMMKGWQQGRLDLYKKEKDAFEASFRQVQAAHEEYANEMKAALEVAKTDLQKGLADAKLAAIKAGDDITAAQIAQGKLDPAIAMTQARQQALEKAAQIVATLAAKQTARGSQLRSALNERLSQNVFRGGAEIARTVQMMQSSGIGQGVGYLGLVTGTGTAGSEFTAALASKVTPEEQKQAASTLRGFAIELATILSGGYRTNQTIVNELMSSIVSRPGDSYATAAYKLLNGVAKARVGIQYSLSYSPEQESQKQQVLKLLSIYPTPESFLTKFGGKRVFRDELEDMAKKNGDDPIEVISKFQDNGFVIEDRLPEITPEDLDPNDPTVRMNTGINALEGMMPMEMQ